MASKWPKVAAMPVGRLLYSCLTPSTRAEAEEKMRGYFSVSPSLFLRVDTT